VTFQLPPVHTVFLAAKLEHKPNRAGRHELDRALTRLENAYPWSAAGLITFVAYGLPYFNRLDPALVDSHMPRLLADPTRWVLEEAAPSPKDVVPGNGITKLRYDVPVVIEDNDVLLTIRGDNADFLKDALAWLQELITRSSIGQRTREHAARHRPRVSDRARCAERPHRRSLVRRGDFANPAPALNTESAFVNPSQVRFTSPPGRRGLPGKPRPWWHGQHTDSHPVRRGGRPVDQAVTAVTGPRRPERYAEGFPLAGSVVLVGATVLGVRDQPPERRKAESHRE
jgi:hypothetical protein